MKSSESRLARSFFEGITSIPRTILFIGLAGIVLAGSFLPSIVKDTTVDSFLRDDNPALIYRDKTEEIFGLADPLVIAVINKGGNGIYNPASLELVQWLTDEVSKLDNVDPDGITSLATESNIVGTTDGMVVEEFFESESAFFTAPLGSQSRADEIRSAIEAFPLLQGSLVARNGEATIIVAELIDEANSPLTYQAVLDLVESAPRSDQDVIHVAGEGAVSGYLADYIDADAQRLNPIAGVVITIILVLAFFSVRGALLPNIVVLAAVVGTFGVMAAFGVSFFVITNGLVVNLIGIAVADSIHVFSRYYEELRNRPEETNREIVVRALIAMWRPITFTSLTTAAGFIALYASSEMPPLSYFGLFGALGVAIAWLYSITFLPAAMVLFPKKQSRSFKQPNSRESESASAQIMTRYGRMVLAHPQIVLGISVGIVISGLIGATQLIVEDQRIESFQSHEPLYQADKAINRSMDGTYYLDVMIDTDVEEGLHNAEYLQRIEALQKYLETLPNVGGTTSIVDYIKQMHRAVNENDPKFYSIPKDPLLISQLFLLYSASGDPTDFEEETDYGYQRALVRANLNQSTWRQQKTLIPEVEQYLVNHFNAKGIRGTVTGSVNVSYNWFRNIASSHALSVALAFAAILLMATVLFRSLLGGAIAVLPVAMSVLFIYAFMGITEIWLGIATSMFAAIAIGLGIDFAIHTLDKIRDLVSEQGLSDSTLLQLFPGTGRALLFNFIAISAGFAVLMVSQVPTLQRFGVLVVVAVTSAFLASITVIPVLVKLLRPAFLTDQKNKSIPFSSVRQAVKVGSVSLLLVGIYFLAPPTKADDELSGLQIMEQVDARDEGHQLSRDLTMLLTARSGTKRVQHTRSFRKYFGDEKRTVIFYLKPTNVRGTGFLTYDYADPDSDDDQWLYLPALRKVRRISASNRGDYFLGTDLAYEEIKKENKVELSDYNFTSLGSELVDGHKTLLIEGIPKDKKIAKELGYGKVIWQVDPLIWMSRKSDYWDTNGNVLKTIHLLDVANVQGIWTALKLSVENHKSGHSTVLTFSNSDYETEIPDRFFDQATLRRGI